MKKSLIIFIGIVQLLLVNACSLQEIKQQSIEIENLAKISGKAIVKEGTEHTIMLAAITFSNEKATIIDQSKVDKDGAYQFYLLPGEYFLAAYEDKNKNRIRDENEAAGMYSQNGARFTSIILTDKQALELDTIIIDPSKNITSEVKIHYNGPTTKEDIGRIISLDDKIFSKENSNMGLWRPIDFFTQVGGGLMFLQPYEENKIPVLFVHGISGNPTEFKHIIKALDHDKFQPWVLYYPSGLPLSLISEYLVKTLSTLHQKHGFNNMQLISHSMGGLISRDYLRLQEATPLPFKTSVYVTINSPMHGLDSATSGVNDSPIVIPVWRDLASDSDFLKTLHQWTLPKSIPYHLFFSYLPDKDGDGSVPLHSQLSLSLQDEAVKIHATQGSHAGVLQDKQFINRIINIINTYE